MSWEWLILPSIGSAIGWFTNFLAIRMLFHPKKPIRIWGALSFQGVLPRRREDLANVVAETVERDLLPMDELLEHVNVRGYQGEVVDAVVRYVDRRMDEQLPESIPRQFRAMIAGYVRRVVSKEAQSVVRDVAGRLTERIRDEVSVAAIVRGKMARLDTDELERIVARVAHNELRVIEVLGAVLGAVIGLFQAAVLTWL